MEKSKRTISVDTICLTEAELADVICEGINEFCSSGYTKYDSYLVIADRIAAQTFRLADINEKFSEGD